MNHKKIFSIVISLLLHMAIIWLFFTSSKKTRACSPVYQVSFQHAKRLAPKKQRKKTGGTSAFSHAQNKVQTQKVTHDENWFPIAAAQQEFVAPSLHQQRPRKQKQFKMSGERLTPPQGNIAKILQKVRMNKTGRGCGMGNGDGIGDGNAFFNVGIEANNIVYVIDISPSMNLYRAKKQLQQSYAKLTAQHTFNIVAFEAKVYVWKDKLQSATHANKTSADRWVKRLQLKNTTNLYHALKVTYEMIYEDTAIYLVSDGYTVKENLLLRHISRWQKNNINTSLNVIAVGSPNRSFLKNLAQANNGFYVEK